MAVFNDSTFVLHTHAHVAIARKLSTRVISVRKTSSHWTANLKISFKENGRERSRKDETVGGSRAVFYSFDDKVKRVVIYDVAARQPRYCSFSSASVAALLVFISAHIRFAPSRCFFRHRIIRLRRACTVEFDRGSCCTERVASSSRRPETYATHLHASRYVLPT